MQTLTGRLKKTDTKIRKKFDKPKESCMHYHYLGEKMNASPKNNYLTKDKGKHRLFWILSLWNVVLIS